MNSEINPFSNQKENAQVSVMANSDAERSIQEVQASLVIAKKFPRDNRNAMENIINACTRKTLADAAIYSYPRGGVQVNAPSIRLAEAIAQQWENIQFGIIELSQENGVSTVEAFAWDLQTNTKQKRVFHVKHERAVKNKITNTTEIKRLTDPRDIYEMVANQGARRMRACILSVIPGDVVEAAVEQCNKTQHSNIDISQESIKKMLTSFEDFFGVTQDHIEKKIGRRADSINAPQMVLLRQIFQSLKDGMAKPWDFFEISETEKQSLTKRSTISISVDKSSNELTESQMDEMANAAKEKQYEMAEGKTEKTSAQKAKEYKEATEGK